MKNCCSWLPEAVAIGAVAIGVGVAFQGWPAWPQAEGQTWAAWVQAIGSVVAILAAIWVAKDQHDKAERRRADDAKNEVRNFLFGIREELHINWVVYMQTVGDAVLACKAGTAVDLTWPVPQNPFKVYASTVGLIGRVPDDVIRKNIVATYVVAGGLLLTWEMHNNMRAERDAEAELIEEMDGARPNGNWVSLNRDLTRYSKQLVKHQNEAAAMINITVALIDSYLKKAS